MKPRERGVAQGEIIRLVTGGWGTATILTAAFVWSYWPTLSGLWQFWSGNPDYSSGGLVPVVAGYVVWTDRKALRGLSVQPCWWGLAVLLVAQAVRLCGLLLSYGSLEQYSLVLSVMGAVLLVLGGPVTRRLAWVLVFLVILVPLPRRAHMSLSLPLQDFATRSARFGLEVLGYLVEREGNILRLSDQNTIAVAEACSGLRMLTAFVVVAAALAFGIHRPRWQKAIIVLSSIPVAIFGNTLRLVATAIVYEAVGSQAGERFFHDFAGLSMMPVAVAVLLVELRLLRWLAPPTEAKAGLESVCRP